MVKFRVNDDGYLEYVDEEIVEEKPTKEIHHYHYIPYPVYVPPYPWYPPVFTNSPNWTYVSTSTRPILEGFRYASTNIS